MDDRFIYQKKDFVNVGVKPGSFSRLLKTLDLEQPEYMTIKQLGNGINAKFFTQEAMEKVVQYLEERKQASNSTELALIQQNTELKKKVELYELGVKVLNTEHENEIHTLKEEWNEKEKGYIKETENQKRAVEKAQQELENISEMSWWQFRKWKKKQGK